MDRMHVFLVVLLGALSSSHNLTSGTMLQITVKPGENITLYCDCKTSTGVFIVWYRNCSHEKQPSLVLKTKFEQLYYEQGLDVHNFLNPFPNFRLVNNDSSQSYDLLITNITDSDEGLYYCGTEHFKVEEKDKIDLEYVYRYGNVTTRILFDSTDSSEPYHHATQEDCGTCWTMLFSLCPASVLLSALLSSVLMYYCQKTAEKTPVREKRHGNRGQTSKNQDEGVCYAALQIRQPSQRAKKRTAQSSDFSTYSAVTYSGNDTITAIE